MCIGSMSLPNTDAAIPGSVTARRAQLPSENPVRTTLTSTIPSASRTATGENVGVSGVGGVVTLNSSFSSSSAEAREDVESNDDEEGESDDQEKRGGTKKKFKEEDDDDFGDGSGGDDDFSGGEGEDEDEVDDDIEKDDEGDIDDEGEDEEGPTTSPHRIVSPLIRAVQGERQINRRGRNSLFIKQGRRTGAHRVDGRIVNSTTRSQSFVSPIESGLIPLRR